MIHQHLWARRCLTSYYLPCYFLRNLTQFSIHLPSVNLSGSRMIRGYGDTSLHNHRMSPFSIIQAHLQLTHTEHRIRPASLYKRAVTSQRPEGERDTLHWIWFRSALREDSWPMSRGRVNFKLRKNRRRIQPCFHLHLGQFWTHCGTATIYLGWTIADHNFFGSCYNKILWAISVFS